MNILKDEYEKCRGSVDGIPFFKDSKYTELMDNITDKFLELITPCSHIWPPENEEEEQTLYMAAHAFSPELMIREFRIWIANVERDYKCCEDHFITQFCEFINAYGKLPLDTVNPQKFMPKDEPWPSQFPPPAVMKKKSTM